MATSSEPILAGLRIVEISAFVAAPLGGATLAALGADVIRVDPPGGGLDIGRWPEHQGQSLYWTGLNQGKRSVTIDLRSESGQRQVARLITSPGDGAGILLTNLPSLGWSSYEELSRLRPDLIMIVITGNSDGSTAVDYTINAALGFPWITGPEGLDLPVNHVLPAWDLLTGLFAVTAVLAAERHRRLTGNGQLVQVSLADVGIAVTGYLGLLGEALLNDEPRQRFGNDVYGTFGRDFGTADGRRVMVLALTPRQWRNLQKATGLASQLAVTERRLSLDFEKEGDRWRGREEICNVLGPWIEQRRLDQLREIFDNNGVLWGPYQTLKQLVSEDPRASTANPMLRRVDHPGLSSLITSGSPLRFGAAAAVPPRPAPVLGQHTAQVIEEFKLDGKQ